MPPVLHELRARVGVVISGILTPHHAFGRGRHRRVTQFLIGVKLSGADSQTPALLIGTPQEPVMKRRAMASTMTGRAR